MLAASLAAVISTTTTMIMTIYLSSLRWRKCD
jgi:hypothetical protein